MLSGSSGLGTLSAPRLLEPRLDHFSSFRSSSAGPSPPCPLSIKVLQAPPVDSEWRHSVGALTHYFGFKSIYIMTFQIYISSLELLLEPNVQLPACHLHSTCPNESTHIFLLQQIILSLPLLRQCQFILPATQGYWVYFWNRPEVNPFSPLLLFAPWCNITSPLAWMPARASSVVSLLLPTCGPSSLQQQGQSCQATSTPSLKTLPGLLFRRREEPGLVDDNEHPMGRSLLACSCLLTRPLLYCPSSCTPKSQAWAEEPHVCPTPLPPLSPLPSTHFPLMLTWPALPLFSDLYLKVTFSAFLDHPT